MSLPPELLNHVNRDLTAKVQKVAADLARAKSLVRMNEEVYRDTMAKVTAAKSQHAALQSVLENNKEAHRQEEERLAVAKRSAEKASATVLGLKNRIADFMTRVTGIDDTLSGRRVVLKEAEDERAQLEEVMLAWLADNAVAGEATSMADSEMKSAGAICKRLQGQADGLQVKIRLMEDALWESSLVSDQVRSEVEGARQQKASTLAEVQNIRNQLEQLQQRASSVDGHQSFVKSQVAALEQQIIVEKTRRDALRKDLDDAQGAVQKTLLSRGQNDSLKGKQHRALVSAQALAKEEEHKCDELEIQIRVTKEETRRLCKQKADMEDHCASVRVRYNKLEEKLATLRIQYEETVGRCDDEDGSSVSTEQLSRQLAKELMDLDTALMRGQHMLQQRRREMIVAAQGTDAASDDYGRLQRHLLNVRQQQHALSTTLQNLVTASSAIDEEASAVDSQLRSEKLRQAEASADLRRDYHARIAQLRSSLHEYERINLAARKSVEVAQSSMRAEARGLEGERDLLASLEEEQLQTRREINRIVTELEQLAVEKERVGSTAEGLHWQVEAMRQQAEGIKGELYQKYHDQEEMGLAMKQQEAAIKSTIDGLRVTLHAHQEDRTKMGIRFNAIASRCSLMQSRYADMMGSLTRKVYGPEGPDGKGAGVALAITVGDGAHDLPSMDGTEHVTPEDLQAHMLLGRAQERDELLQKGNGLDSAIVAAERDLKQLSVAVDRLQHSYSTGRAMVRDGHDADAVLFGESLALPVMLEDGPSADEEALIQFVRSRLEENTTQDLLTELREWRDRVDTLHCELVGCRAQESAVRASLEQVTNRLGQVKVHCSARLRFLDDLARECDRESHQSDKSRTVAFIKQAALLKQKNGTLAFAQVAGEDRIDEAVRRLVYATSGRSPDCFYALRHLADKFGLPVDKSAFAPQQMSTPVVDSTLLSQPSNGVGMGSARSSSAQRRGGVRSNSRGLSSVNTTGSQQTGRSARISALDPNVAPARIATRALVKQYATRQAAQQEHAASYADPLSMQGRGVTLGGVPPNYARGTQSRGVSQGRR